MDYRPSAERTRSRRWRAGSRRNKRYSITHIQVCPMPEVCLIHRKGVFPRHPAMAMKLTRCEQQWVDDMRSDHVHIHMNQRRKPWETALLALRQRINTERFRRSGTINQCSPGIGMDYGYHNPYALSGMVGAMDIAIENARQAELYRMQLQAITNGR